MGEGGADFRLEGGGEEDGIAMIFLIFTFIVHNQKLNGGGAMGVPIDTPLARGPLSEDIAWIAPY